MKTLLLVEDNRALAAHWQEAFENEDFRVIHEVSVEGAIDVLDTTRVDLVITDIVLESQDEQLRFSGGLAVISYIALNVEPQPKIIATSGRESKAAFVDRNFQRMNSMRAMRKPFDVADLVAAANELLSRDSRVSAAKEIQSALHSRVLLDVLGTTDGVFDWDIATDEIEFSAGWRQMLGFDADDLDGYPNTLSAFRDRIHPRDREEVWAAVNLTLTGGAPYQQEFRIQGNDGQYIWLQSRGTASFNARDEAMRLVGVAHDITEQQLATARIRHAIDSAASAMVQVSRSGVIELVNRQAEELFGYPTDELLGQPIEMLMPARFREQHTGLVAEFQQNRKPRAMGSGRKLFGLRKDGSEFPLEIGLNPLPEDAGDSTMATIIDVSERMQQTLQQRQSQFAMDNANDAIFWIREDSSFFYVNQQASAFLGYTREELCTMKAADIGPEFPPERWPEHWRDVQRLGALHFETTHRRKDGSTYPCEIVSRFIDFEGQQFIFATVRDLTESKAIQTELSRGRFFLDNSQDATYWVKEDSRFVYANKAATEMLGYSREQLLQMRVVDIDPAYPADVWKRWWEQMRAERHNVVETQHKDEDGNSRWVEVAVHFIEHDGEEFIVGVTRDIDDRVNAQRQLARSDFFLENSREATYWVRQDASFAYANKAACDELGFPREELLRMRVPDIDPDATPEFWENHWREMQQKKHMLLERTHQRADGSQLISELRLYFVEYDNEEFIVALTRDITDRKLAQQRLKESEERYDWAMTNANIGMWDWEPNTSYVTFSDTTKTQLGYSADEVWDSFEDWESRLHPDDRETAMAAAQALVDHPEQPYISVFRLRTKSGGYRWIRSVGKGIYDEAGNLEKFLGVHIDIHDTEEARRLAQQQARLIQLSHDAIFSWAEDGGIQTWNRGAEQLYGYSADEAAARIPQDLLKSRYPVPFQQIREVIEAEGEWTGELEHCTRDGQPITVATRLQIVEMDGSSMILETTRDITEWRAAERERQAVAARFEQIVEFMPIAVVYVDAERRIQKVNPAFEQLFGYETEEVLGRTTQFFYADPDDFGRAGKKRFSPGAKPTNEPYEVRYRCKDGSEFIGETLGTAISSVDGDSVAYVGLVTDITDRKHAEQLLLDAKKKAEASEERFEWAMSNANIGLWEFNPVTGDLVFNETLKAQLGYPSGSTWTESDQNSVHSLETWAAMVHPDDREVAVRKAQQLTKNPREPYDSTCRLRTALGDYRWIRSVGRGVFDEADSVTRCLGVHIDVHEAYVAKLQLEQLNDELHRSNADLEQFAYVASHDLKQPLRGIDYLARRLQDEVGELVPEESRQRLSQITQRVGRLDTLLNDLLHYSRVSRTPQTISAVDTGQLVRGIAETLVDSDSFIVECTTEMPVVDTLRAPLDQVFRNLIGNAIKHHNSTSGRIQISSRRIAEEIEFRVEDDGPGIAPEFHDRIFQMFNTLKPRDEVEGSGMGLALVRKIVESNGGAIRVESQEGRGSTFIFTWPVPNSEQSL